MEVKNNKVAVLIDAENTNAANARQIFDTMSAYGEVIIRQIFADWSNEAVKNWKNAISNFSIVSNQQFSYVSKKNSSDIALVIQAMNILFERDVDIFCLVSSDSDFTRLVQELRERGKTVIGMGGRTSVKPFVNAFTEFLYLGEDVAKAEPKAEAKKAEPEPVKEPAAPAKEPEPELPGSPCKVQPNGFIPLEDDKMVAIRDIIETRIDESGKAYYSQIGTDMKNKFPDFVPKNYHCKSLKFLIDHILTDLPGFEKGKDTFGQNKGAEVLYLIRKKEKKTPAKS